MLLVIDFDGTLCVQDTVDWFAAHFDPAGFAVADAAFSAGELTLNETLATEVAGVDATTEEILGFLLETVQVRDGVPELIAWCSRHDVEPVIVSSGFTNLMEPFLAAHGLALPVLGHELVETPEGLRIRFRDRDQCAVCGEPCKRSEVASLSADRPVAYVGDGASDLCAAEVADVRFARSSLARHLGAADLAYLPFEDFHDVRVGLARALDVAP